MIDTNPMFSNIIRNYDKFKDSPYINKEGFKVPRVSNILSSMLHEDSLMSWSNYIGKKGQDYKETLEFAADIGRWTHHLIENFFLTGVIGDSSIIEYSRGQNFKQQIENAFLSFVQWWHDIQIGNVVIPLANEHKLVSDFFGGTLDFLMSVNEDIYLVDFKTSNHCSYRYFLQMAAYKYMLKENYNINLSGVIILMLDKNTISYRDIVCRCSSEFIEEYQMMENFTNEFFTLLNAYYGRLNTEIGFNKIYKENLKRIG